MAPTLGRIVLVTLHEGMEINGSRVHPAIVTAVHSETMINARVMTDGPDNPPWVTSIPRADSESAVHFGGAVWSWPPRVEV
jgi:hypothetical protein